MLEMESTAHLPPTFILEEHLTKNVKVTKEVYPHCRISYWDVYYDPDFVARDGTPLPWIASAASKVYRCDTLARLLEALKKEEDDALTDTPTTVADDDHSDR